MKNQSRFLFILLSVFFITIAHSKEPVVCDSKYVLCNAAPCQAIPGMKDRALCTCSIWEGKNIGYSACEQRNPQTAPYQQTKLLSTFSFGGMHYKYIHCKAGTPWTNCLDQECFIDKNDPRRAHCNCKIEEGTAYVTFAGMCDINACDKSMWSGAKADDNLKFMNLLSKDMAYETPPMRACLNKHNENNEAKHD
ncbi:hypothetical protein E3983_03030 [Legionella israelensis]|uniref:Neurogenic locus notch like protein n=1 Tax=Legionella israelensis TaxID=454 RepID=A0AAX1EEA8_9GAMM|nr:hypothetical protein [Legionella israelensis]QBR83428.1 hypothetical protein E3983_03030 [Legionella israelensis]